MKIKRLSVLTVFGFFLFIFNSCNRSNPSGIPYVPVNFQLIVSNPQFAALQAVSGSVEIDGGSRGIIVYRFSPEEFRAYDRHCTFQIEENCQASIDASGVFAVCDGCGDSRYQLVDGAVIEGPAVFGLQPYNTSFDGNTLSIFN